MYGNIHVAMTQHTEFPECQAIRCMHKHWIPGPFLWLFKWEAKKALELSKIDQENRKLETVTPPIHCLSLSLKSRMHVLKLSGKGNPFLKLVQNRIQLSLWLLNHLRITLLLYWASSCQSLLHSVSGSGHHLLVSWGSPDGRSAAGAWEQSLRSSSLCSLVRPCLWDRQQDNRSLAIEQVFSEAKIFLCSFHRKQLLAVKIT